jgi:sugar lactone lactonase YvrE
VSVGTAKVTSCTFAGPEFDQLVITTASVDTDDEGAGSLYRYRPGDVVGTAVHRYAG